MNLPQLIYNLFIGMRITDVVHCNLQQRRKTSVLTGSGDAEKSQTCLLRTAKSIFGKHSPFARLILLFQQTIPSLCFRIPCERIVERAVRVFKNKLDAVAGALAVTQRFRESTPEY